MNKLKAAQHINKIAKPDPTGLCARHVRLALMEAGVPLTNWPEFAKDYKWYLQKYGFQELSPLNYKPETGDIVVLEQHPGGHVAGHIAMYDGTRWISDFVQRDHWGGPGWRNNKTPHVFMRHVETTV